MAVKQILEIAGAKMGLDSTQAQPRLVLLRFLNEAAIELYDQSDMPGSLFEQTMRVNGDQSIALPPYVGELRAVREFNSYIPWHINQMRPRYNQANWKDIWRNWRIKNHQALAASIRNQSVVNVVVDVVEVPNVVVTITGSTSSAASITEDVTISSATQSTIANFLEISAIIKNRVNNQDIYIRDVDDLELARIPNNVMESSYLIIDVSMLPWNTTPSSQQDHYVEVLYKKSLPWLSKDGDHFPAQGYDHVLVNKMLQLWAEEQGKSEQAIGYDAKATRSLARKTENENRATEDMVAFVMNPHDSMLAKLRTNRPGREWSTQYPFGAG